MEASMRALLFICLSIYTSFVAGQPFPSLVFSHITEKSGLSNNDVQSITQDERGFIWIATRDGVNRLDGDRVRTFYHKPNDSNSLVNNGATQVVRGAGGDIWISTVEGISCYNARLHQFTNFRRQPSDPLSLQADYGRGMFFDSARKEVWVNVPGYMYCFNGMLRYTAYPLDPMQHPPALQKIPIHYLGMYEDRQGQWWVFFDSWIFKVDKLTKRITASFPVPSVVDVRALIEDNQHHYWVGTFGGGLLQFHPENGTFVPVPLEGGDRFIYSLCEWKDNRGRTWIVAGSTDRLTLVDPSTWRSKIYSSDALNDFSILTGDVNCLFVDKKNILWIGTANGVSYVAPSRQKMGVWDIMSREDRYKGSRNDLIYGFAEDGTQCLGSCWTRDSLFRWDEQGKRLPSKINTRVYGILRQGDVFLMAADSGIFEYGRDNTTFIPLKGSGFRSLVQYDDSTYWIRTRNNGANGIYVYNSRKKSLTAHYFGPSGCKECLPPRLHDMIITRNKEIFTSPQDHYLYRFDRQRQGFVPFFDSAGQTAALPSQTFDCLAEDAAGHLWVGTSNGLFELDVVSKKMIRDLTRDTRIAGAGVEALCFDDDDNLWMNTERGLFCLAARTDRVYHFNTGDGLPNNSLPGFLYKGTGGYLFAGGLGYILKFRPADILFRELPGDVEISDIMIMNSPAPMVDKDEHSRKLVLKPGENLLSIDYCVLDYDNAAGSSFYYKLDGGMKEWKESTDGHLSFYNLPPAEYLLHVKARDRYGSFSRNENLLSIVVRPYWWQSRWFYGGVVIMVILLVYLFMRRRIRAIREQSGIRTKMAETEMMALRAQMNPHFIFNSLNIVDGLISGNRRDEAKDFLQKFSKLIRLTLENSQQQLVPLESDLRTLKLYTELEWIRYNHSFAYNFDVDEALLDEGIRIPPLLLQPYVENAIIHGLRSRGDGEGRLFVSIRRDGEALAVVIDDNGVGRSKAAEINAANNKIQKHLGMEVTGKRIELLKTISSNKISVEVVDLCEAGRTGTRVRLSLPLDYHISGS